MTRALAQKYRIYKDRFILSLSLSLLVHIFAIYLYYLLPTHHKETTLRPISLGVLQTQKPMQDPTKTQVKQESQTQTTTKQTMRPKEKSLQKPKVQPPNPSQSKPQSPPTPVPNPNVDLNSLSLPQKQQFNPLATPQPSLTQSLKEQQENAKLEALPQRAQEELYKLYGTQLNHMSKEQKNYLAESYFLNTEVFQQTADRMGYPKLAIYLKQQGKGIIEFTLYPDGHVDNIKIITSTNYEALDDSMKQVVEQSAKNLKRPPVPVVVRLGGNYQLTPGF